MQIQHNPYSGGEKLKPYFEMEMMQDATIRNLSKLPEYLMM